MSWDVLCQGRRFGHDEFLVIQRVASRVVNRRRAHIRELGWIEAPHVQLAREFFTQEDAVGRLTALCEKAGDKVSFHRLLYRALDNLLLDRHRQTDAGAAARRIKNLLRGGQRFIEAPMAGSWSTPRLGRALWDGDEAPLLAAAGNFRFIPLEYTTDRRRSPVISDANLLDLLELVIETAGGAVPLSALVRIVRLRTGLGAVPTFVELIDEEEGYDEDDPVLRDEARALLGRLDERERVLLRYSEKTVRRKAEILGVSPSTVSNITAHLREKLTPYHVGDQEPRVLRYVLEILEDNGQAPTV